jgi:hypothetical protein
MSTAVEINGLSLIPIREAASHVSYSRDYVARLAREGKIVASQIGRQWFVDLSSLQNFSAEASALDDARRLELRAERKRELMAKDSLSVLDERVAVRIAKQRFDAIAVTAVVVCLGLFTGVGVYTAATVPGSLLEDLSDSLAVVSIPVQPKAPDTDGLEPVLAEATEVHSTLLLNTVIEQPVFVAESETERIENGLQGVLVLAPGSGVPSSESVGGMFSDEVVVTFSDSNTGVISYEGEESVKEYPFVLVPSEEGNSKVGTP